MTETLDSLLVIAGKASARIRAVVMWLVFAFFSYMGIAVLAQVVGRYIFNYSVDWAAETATFAQIWMILLAAGLAMEKNLHVCVDVLTGILPASVLRILTIVVGVSCIWFLWQAIVGSLALIDVGQIQTSPVLRVPMWIPYLSLPIGLSYFGLELILSLVTRWKDPKGLSGKPDSPAI
jgi:TRAP-type C4-dicarboxylate transport system permease small subunit